MHNRSTKTRSLWLTVLSIMLCCTLFPLQVQAEQQQHTITIREDQEWGQIIVESNVSNFEVDIVTPDGSKWTHSEETDVDVLFYYSFETMRHWASETMKAGTYQIYIDGPIDATYTIRNQDSYDKISLNLTEPSKKTIDVKTSSYTFDVAWSYTGDILRNNPINFYLVSADGGEQIELGNSSISLNRWSFGIPDDLIDGSYKLLVSYDNNTAEISELDPEVTFQMKRGFIGEKIAIMDAAAAGAELYADLNLPSARVDGIEVALVENGVPNSYSWLKYELSELTKLEAPEVIDDNSVASNYEHRYSIFVPVPQNGSYKLAVRPIMASGLSGAISVSEQQIDILAKEWPENLVSWSLPDGVTNVEYGELTVTYTEPIQLQLTANGELVYEQEINSASEPWTLQIPLSEGENSYELVLYDSYGNYYTDGRIWTVDYTAPWLEMIGPLPTHSKVPSNLVSGWTEKNVTVTINDKDVTVDEHGYFQFESKAKAVNIVVADESGNETVYHWSKQSRSNGLTTSQWILLMIGSLVLLGLSAYLFVRQRK